PDEPEEAMVGTTSAALMVFSLLGSSASKELLPQSSESGPEASTVKSTTVNDTSLDGADDHSADYSALYERYFTLAMPKNRAENRYVIRKARAAGHLIHNSKGYFTDLKYFDNQNDGSRAFIQHGYRLTHMTEAFHLNKPENRYYNNPNMKRKIILGFEYIIDKAPSNRDWNWWGRQIGAPKSLWEAFLLASTFLERDLLLRGLRRYWIETKVWDSNNRSGKMAGSNLANRGFLTLVQTYLEG
ncbi:unnamed protein product, partial [Owenia fusiformis]